MCTIFSVSKENHVFFGNTEDNIRKRDETFIAFIPSQKFPAKWIYPGREGNFTNYGFMLLGVREGNYLYPQGGINEHGLAYDINALPLAYFNGIEGKAWKTGFNYFDLLMTTKNLDEIAEHFDTYNQNPRQWGAGQIHFADALGKSAVFGIDKEGNLGRVFKGSQNYLVSTNFSLNNTDDKIGYPCKRHETASNHLEILSKQEHITQEDCRQILDEVKIQYGKKEPNHGTVYGNVFNLANKEIWLYHLDDFSTHRTFQLDSELERVKKNKIKSDYIIGDDSVEKRFIFSEMEVNIIDQFF
jgi:penicillin V acylase-like amidase (Ntn superfamily)